ncbi:MAG: glycosyltransferase family 2 protein [Betaproteobacteria bacterium]|nr:glycosyltransferase family 2 protein [Betaproteobacteria bacterium]
MPAPRSRFSLVVIALNAASQLRACLESARFADEIVLVDSGSTDATVALAREFGAKVVRQTWLGFGPQKQFAVEQAAHDWVLCLDADERLTPELQASIDAALREPQHTAYRFPRRNRFLGRYLRHGEGYPDWSLRLFDRRRARWSDDAVHEKVIVGGAGDTATVGVLRGDLLHDSAETLGAYLSKQNRYTTLAAEAAFNSGKRGAASQVWLSPLVRFLKFYVLRRGFLDGLPGFIHILIGCFNSFSKYAKMVELQNTEIRL